MAVRSGQMRFVISVQQQATTLDDFGQQTQTWAEVFSCRAAIEWTPGREVFQAAHRSVRVPTIFRIRYRQGVKASMRIVFDNRVFDIKSVIDQAGRREELIITAEELVEEAP